MNLRNIDKYGSQFPCGQVTAIFANISKKLRFAVEIYRCHMRNEFGCDKFCFLSFLNTTRSAAVTSI
jgi:hypothetical protein